MRVVLQRVSNASVIVQGEIVGAVGAGVLLLVGFADGDEGAQLEWMAEKIVGLRIFPDVEGRMNRSLVDVGGAALVVSQFTLYADTRKGRRPSFVQAADPGRAEPLFQQFAAALRARGISVATGVFGAVMEVHLVNDGPVTLLLER